MKLNIKSLAAKILSSVFLASLASVSTAEPVVDPEPETEIITHSETLISLKITNRINVKSAAMQAWSCGAGLLNKTSDVGSDNRLYGTAKVFKKGTSTLYTGALADTTNNTSVVVEANSDSSTELADGAVHLNYFNTSTHTEISDLRAEFSSLNYGVGMYVDVCFDLPFSYEQDTKTMYSGIKITTNQSVLNLDNATETERTSYISGAEPTLSTEVQCSTDHGNVAVNSAQSELLGMVNFLDNPEYIGVNSQPVTSDQQYTGLTHMVEAETANNIKKCVVRFVFQESANETSRVKGIAEGLKWQTHVEIDLED